MTDELLACFDIQGNPIAPHVRSEALAQPFPDYYHAVANIWLIDRAARMFCSKRSPLVSAEAGKWQTRFGGHVAAGHTYLDTAIKELYEEAGLLVTAEDLVLLDRGSNSHHQHFYENYMLLYDPQVHNIVFRDGEVSEGKWFTMDEYNADRLHGGQKWCNGIDITIQQKIIDIVRNLV